MDKKGEVGGRKGESLISKRKKLTAVKRGPRRRLMFLQLNAKAFYKKPMRAGQLICIRC